MGQLFRDLCELERHFGLLALDGNGFPRNSLLFAWLSLPGGEGLSLPGVH